MSHLDNSHRGIANRARGKLLRHPMQPIYRDDDGVHRFKGNEIVRYLLDNGGIDLNQLAVIPFDRWDREQFAQLVGYSCGGFSDLSYVSGDTRATMMLMEADLSLELEKKS